MQDLLAINQTYMAHFAPRDPGSVPREGPAAEPVLPSGSSRSLPLNTAMVETLVNTRYSIILLLSFKSLVDTTEPYFKQLEEQVWLSPALADASLAQLAAWCQYHYFQHTDKQQQQEQVQGREGEVCKQKQKLQKQGGTDSSKKSSGTSSTGVGSSSSSRRTSSSSSKVATFKFTSASSWSELKVPPDHEQAAVAGGQAAVAAHLWRLARVRKGLTPTELQMEVLCAAMVLRRSLLPEVGLQEGEKEPLPGDVRLSRRPAATVTALQLAVEGLACQGIELEAIRAGVRASMDGSSQLDLVWQTACSPSGVLGIKRLVDLLLKQVEAADVVTRRAFLAARGEYALQVLWLLMKMAVEEQQQWEQQQQQQQQPHQVSALAALVPGIMCQMVRATDGDKNLSGRSPGKFKQGERLCGMVIAGGVALLNT
jgi:hypothetical protein